MRRPLRDVFLIRTPENVTFEFELAGLGSRALAWLVDVGVMLVMTVFSLILVTLFSAGLSQAAVRLGGFAVALGFLAVFLIVWWYSAITEWWFAGQTFGKMAVGIRTLSETGTRITFLQAVIRNLVRVVDLLPVTYLVGGVASLVDSRGRRIGDVAAGTVVVRKRRAPRPGTIVPRSARYNSFVEDPAVLLSVRRITPPERDAMISLGTRRDQMPLSVRHELFQRLSTHLEARLGVPRPDFFSDEKYVLNLTAVALGAQAERRGPR